MNLIASSETAENYRYTLLDGYERHGIHYGLEVDQRNEVHYQNFLSSYEFNNTGFFNFASISMTIWSSAFPLS